MARLNWKEIAPEGAKAMFVLHDYVTRSTALGADLVNLVFLRVSQLNGCAYCIDKHSRDLRASFSADKVTLVAVWKDAPHLFTSRERAALAWAEEVTRVGDTHASDEAYAAASYVFSPKDLVDLTITIATMNAFNRIGVPFRLDVAAKE